VLAALMNETCTLLVRRSLIMPAAPFLLGMAARSSVPARLANSIMSKCG